MAVNQKRPDASRVSAAAEQVLELEGQYGGLEPARVLELSIDRLFPGQIAAVSSFGADSAVLLHMIVQIDHSFPVLFLDTQKHFEATIDYRNSLVSDLGLTNVNIIEPEVSVLEADDPDGKLHVADPDACCHIRKVEPMARAVSPYRAWFTGRKRFQSGTRARLPVFEAVGDQIRINPLALWTSDDIEGYMYTNNLRRHPLVSHGYLSIGCQPCTSPVETGQSSRSGRWSGSEKTECGIHVTPAGVVRASSGIVEAG